MILRTSLLPGTSERPKTPISARPQTDLVDFWRASNLESSEKAKFAFAEPVFEVDLSITCKSPARDLGSRGMTAAADHDRLLPSDLFNDDQLPRELLVLFGDALSSQAVFVRAMRVAISRPR